MWASITLASMYFLSITWELLFSKDPDIELSFKNFTDHGSAILGRNERCSRWCRRWPPLKVHIEWLWDCAVSTKHDGTLSFHQMDYIVEAFLFLVANPDCVVVDTSEQRVSRLFSQFWPYRHSLLVRIWSWRSECAVQGNQGGHRYLQQRTPTLFLASNLRYLRFRASRAPSFPFELAPKWLPSSPWSLPWPRPPPTSSWTPSGPTSPPMGSGWRLSRLMSRNLLLLLNVNPRWPPTGGTG